MQYMHIDLQISEGPKVHGPLFLGGGGSGLVTAAIGEKNGDPFSFSTICPPPLGKKACSALASAGPPVLVLRGF